MSVSELPSPYVCADCLVRLREMSDHLLRNRCNIMKTSPCIVDFLTSHFYIVKLGFTGVYIIFLFLLLNIDCGYSLEPPHWGGSNVYPLSMF